MLRTNTKQARANIRAYIVYQLVNIECLEDYGVNVASFVASEKLEDIASVIISVCDSESYGVGYEAFKRWAYGLPSVLNTDDYLVHRSAVNIVGNLLEETAEEKLRFTEEQAEELLTKLIYRELKKAC